MQRIKKFTLTYLFLFISIFAIGCNQKPLEDTSAAREEFAEYTNDLFVKEVQSDSITLNYTLAHPENYGITEFVPTFGAYTVDSIKESLADSENQLAKLKSMDYDSLSKEQKLTYDILKYTADENLGFDSKMFLYPEVLSPTLGIQSQLPVLLAEFNFYTKEDIEHYIELLPTIQSYYNDIISYEKEKSKAGLFMSDYETEEIIKQCQSFIKTPKKNLLITIFNERIDKYPDLTKAEKASYKKENREAVLNYVIPSYQDLIQCLKELKGTGVNDAGLCQFPEGKKYYEYLVKNNTGSSKSVQEMLKVLNQSIQDNITGIQDIAAKDPDAIKEMLDVKYGMTDPDEILSYLKKAIEADYPPIEDINYTVKYVDQSLEEYLSPAFYLTPALDNYQNNSIYINKSPQFDLSSIFTTLAHEGYPGHLYQSVFYNQQKPEPLRNLFNFGGYSEGWATYVELESYQFAGFSDNVSALLKMNKAATLALYARVDIGINYEGWNYDKTAEYLKTLLGITDKETVTTFYYAIIEDPANYLKYTMGSLEFKELREKAEKKLGDKFELKNFHEFILKTGPAPFEIIKERMNEWIKIQ